MSTVDRQGSTELAQRRAIGRLRGQPSVSVATTTWAGDYAGLVTRALALALDALIVDGIALLVGVVVGLGVSLLHLPGGVDALIAAIMGTTFVAWSVGYFVFFWSTTGQTIGDRVMRIEVIDGRNRGSLKPRRALLRFVGLILAALPLFAGIVIMLWDSRRRCLHDRLARTVVIYTESPA
jgi:uncharacterized RDD family membrane protein YckC